jgi:hypothetical protein
MSCYDAYKAERAAKAKKQHKNPLIDQFGAEGGARRRPTPVPEPAPQPSAPSSAEPAAASQPETPRAPNESAQKAAPQPAPSAEVCDVCKQPITDMKVPLKGGKKVCLGCNDVLRDVAKSLILNIQCPHCGKDIQVSQT